MALENLLEKSLVWVFGHINCLTMTAEIKVDLFWQWPQPTQHPMSTAQKLFLIFGLCLVRLFLSFFSPRWTSVLVQIQPNTDFCHYQQFWRHSILDKKSGCHKNTYICWWFSLGFGYCDRMFHKFKCLRKSWCNINVLPGSTTRIS